ncbi:MAG: hypothetical protein ACYCTX_04905, partial [Thermoplasmataceae archaeon]
SFTVSGKQVSISVTFQKKAPVITYYRTTFTEGGLPSGTPWFVNISGVPGSGKITGSSYSTTLKYGIYS